MTENQEPTIGKLRSMAQKGSLPSQILREVVARSLPNQPHKLDLIKFMREAFCLTLQQAKPISSWAEATIYAGDGLSDFELDAFLLPEIENNRQAWEQPKDCNSRVGLQ